MKIKDEVNRLRKLAFTEIELKKDDFKMTLRRFVANIAFCTERYITKPIILA